jgi:hypothetical protein
MIKNDFGFCVVDDHFCFIAWGETKSKARENAFKTIKTITQELEEDEGFIHPHLLPAMPCGHDLSKLRFGETEIRIINKKAYDPRMLQKEKKLQSLNKYLTMDEFYDLNTKDQNIHIFYKLEKIQDQLKEASERKINIKDRIKLKLF